MQMTDRIALIKLERIVSSEEPDCEKFEQLDRLIFDVENYHPHHMAARVLETIRAAQTKTLGKES